MDLERLESRRLLLGTLPTPLEDVGQLPDGRRLYVKRDDLTGLGLGGNKVRKLEMLAYEAAERGADCLVTVGAAQSNHARATAAAGARLGVETHLVLGGDPPDRLTGNQLLSSLFGAALHYAGTDEWTELSRQRSALVAELRARHRTPFDIPMGGSSPVGALGFARAWVELLMQLRPIGADIGSVVVASSTGGTHAGMLVGASLMGGPEIIAVDVAKESSDLAGDTHRLADAALALVDPLSAIDPGLVHVDSSMVGAGYAVPTEEADTAMIRLARSSGLVLDRTYTAKAFAGLTRLMASGDLPDGDVVFWHTGGQPATFADDGCPASPPPFYSTRILDKEPA